MTAWLSALALAFLSLGNAATAQDAAKVAVVDYNAILKEYYKAKDSQKQMEDLAAGYQKERNEREAGLKTLVDAINGLQKEMQDPAISDAKKKEKENQLKAKGEEGQVKQREMMAFGQTASKILEDKRQRLTTELTEDVNKAPDPSGQKQIHHGFRETPGSEPRCPHFFRRLG